MTATESPTATLDHALAYAARGWRVHPLRPDARPYLAGWPERAATDPDTIAAWWTEHPTAGIGIATGAGSGIWVLDVDTDRRRGKHGDEALAELEAEHGPLPDTYEVITGSGGRHLYFAWDPAHEIRNDQSGRFGQDLDVRGEGGYVVAPPTPHRLYATPFTQELGAADDPAPAPTWLTALATRPDPEPEPTPRPAPAAEPAGDRPGDLWAAAVDWAAILEPDGWQLDRTDPTGERHWVRPGKDRREGTGATTGYGDADVLKVFTSSMAHAGLHAEETYTKLGYRAAVHHGGDHTAAAAWCRSQGHHKPTPELDDLIGESLQKPPALPLPKPADTPEDPWPAPIPLEVDIPRPRWPEGVLPRWIDDQTRNVAGAVQCDPALAASAALGALSVISLGRAAVEKGPQNLQHTALYLVTIAEVSAGKSGSQKLMHQPLHRFEQECIDQQSTETAKAASRRKIAEKSATRAEDVAAATGNPDDITKAIEARVAVDTIETPHEGRLVTTDITPEKVATAMTANAERIAVVTDEPDVLQIDRYGDRKRGRNLAIFLKSWSGETAIVDRQNAPTIRLTRPLMTFVVASQPEPWREITADAELRNRGFVQRFMADEPPPSPQRDHDIDRNVLDQTVHSTYTDRMLALARRLRSFPGGITLRLDPEAKAAWRAWANGIEARTVFGGELESEKGWISKMLDSVIRTAGLLHLADHYDTVPIPETISADVLRRATVVGDYWLAHRLRLIEQAVTAVAPAKLLAALVRLHDDTPDGLITRRQVGQKGPLRIRTIAEAAPIMDILERHHLARLVGAGQAADLDPETRYTSATGIQVHPDVLRDTSRQVATDTTERTEGGGDPPQSVENVAVSRMSLVTGFSTPLPSPKGPESENGHKPPRQPRQDATPPDSPPTIADALWGPLDDDPTSQEALP